MNVDEMQKKLAVWAKRDPDHRFFDIYHLMYNEDWLHRAYRSVKSNNGSRTAGIDGLRMSDFEEDLEGNLQELRESLKDETFKPKPVRRTYIPKGDGRERPLGIPTIKDRIVQEALRMVLEPIYETDFSQYSYGFRPNRNTMDAVSVARIATREQSKYFWVIDADIKGFFDNVDHQTLEQIIQDRMKDKQIRDLIWEFLKAGIMEEGEYRNSMTGTPQGGIVSPVLANIYLNELDQWVKQFTEISKYRKKKRRENGKGNWMYIRYADDFLLLTNGRKAEAKEMEERLREYLDQELKLTLSRKKTEVVHVNDGFDFLGFHIERGKDGEGGKSTKVTIPGGARQDFREKIHAATDGDTNTSERAKIMALNALIRGWGNYYKYCWDAAKTFNDLSYFVWNKVMDWVARKRKTTKKRVVRSMDTEGSKIKLGGLDLVLPSDLDGAARYFEPIHKEHPYLEGEERVYEELPEDDPWLGTETEKPGLKGQKMKALQRDDWRCQKCGNNLGKEEAEVHHRKPIRKFSNPKQANRLGNLISLCPECHAEVDPHRVVNQ